MRLSKALGISYGNKELVLRALGVDYRGVSAPYKGPMLFKTLPGRRTDPVDGYNMRWVEHASGGYWDFCDFPLANADDETIENFPVPNPDHFDYEAVEQQLSLYKDYAIYVGGAGVPDVINSTTRIMSMEDTLVNLAIEHEPTINFINKRMNMRLNVLERTLDKYRGRIDFMWLGEDWEPHRPLISPEMYRKVLKPIHKRFIDLAKTITFLLFSIHAAVSWAYEEFIEMGIKV